MSFTLPPSVPLPSSFHIERQFTDKRFCDIKINKYLITVISNSKRSSQHCVVHSKLPGLSPNPLQHSHTHMNPQMASTDHRQEVSSQHGDRYSLHSPSWPAPLAHTHRPLVSHEHDDTILTLINPQRPSTPSQSLNPAWHPQLLFNCSVQRDKAPSVPPPPPHTHTLTETRSVPAGLFNPSRLPHKEQRHRL